MPRWVSAACDGNLLELPHQPRNLPCSTRLPGPRGGTSSTGDTVHEARRRAGQATWRARCTMRRRRCGWRGRCSAWPQTGAAPRGRQRRAPAPRARRPRWGDGAGWWRAAGAYLGALLQAGELAEAAGAPDDAAAALREGGQLARPPHVRCMTCACPDRPTPSRLASDNASKRQRAAPGAPCACMGDAMTPNSKLMLYLFQAPTCQSGERTAVESG